MANGCLAYPVDCDLAVGALVLDGVGSNEGGQSRKGRDNEGGTHGERLVVRSGLSMTAGLDDDGAGAIEKDLSNRISGLYLSPDKAHAYFVWKIHHRSLQTLCCNPSSSSVALLGRP